MVKAMYYHWNDGRREIETSSPAGSGEVKPRRHKQKKEDGCFELDARRTLCFEGTRKKG